MSSETYTPNVIARNIVKKGEVLEIKRYNDANLREMAWVWFLVIAFFWVGSIINKDRIYDDMQWAISVDMRLQLRYENDIQELKAIGEKSAYKDYEDFKQQMLEFHGSRRYAGAFFIALPLLLFLWVASPAWRPLRIDTRRRLIYTWSFGRFYITRYPEWAKTTHNVMQHVNTSMKQPWIRYKHHGGLVFHLPHESQPDKTVAIDVGIFRPACPYQNQVLKDFLNDYLSSDNPQQFECYFNKESFILSDVFNAFYRFSLFPAIGFNEKKTEAKIAQWLAHHPE